MPRPAKRPGSAHANPKIKVIVVGRDVVATPVLEASHVITVQPTKHGRLKATTHCASTTVASVSAQRDASPIPTPIDNPVFDPVEFDVDYHTHLPPLNDDPDDDAPRQPAILDPQEHDTAKTTRVRVSCIGFCFGILSLMLLQTAALDDWLPHRQEYLEEVLRLEGEGAARGNSTCELCGVEQADIRCTDCHGCPRRCAGCMVDMHQWLPLHRIQVSSLTSFLRLLVPLLMHPSAMELSLLGQNRSCLSRAAGSPRPTRWPLPRQHAAHAGGDNPPYQRLPSRQRQHLLLRCRWLSPAHSLSPSSMVSRLHRPRSNCLHFLRARPFP